MARIRDVMSTELVTVSLATTVAEAATVMGTRHVGAALVLEDDGLRGIFTERDVLRAVASDFDAEQRTVAEFMTPDPVTTEPERDAGEALAEMLHRGFRHFPVLEGGLVVGVVSLRDLADT